MDSFQNPAIFLIVMFCVSQWTSIALWFSSLLKKQPPSDPPQSNRLIKFIKSATNLSLNKIWVANSPELYGMMVGIPGFPQMILSKALLDSFTWGELRYVVLHEVGHYKLHHSIKEMTYGVLFFGGVMIFGLDFGVFVALVLGVLGGIVLIRIGRAHEYQADRYALERLKDPRFLITATNKFERTFGTKLTKTGLLGELFYRSIPYADRRQFAKSFELD